MIAHKIEIKKFLNNKLQKRQQRITEKECYLFKHCLNANPYIYIYIYITLLHRSFQAIGLQLQLISCPRAIRPTVIGS